MSKTCGYFDILEFRNKDIPVFPGFREYIDEVSSGFCRYIAPSTRMGRMSYTTVAIKTEEIETIEAIVFACGLSKAEILRKNRDAVHIPNRTLLNCDNVLFAIPESVDNQGRTILGWPHWVLKCRYTQIGILFGKFWKGAIEQGKDGRQLPIPPQHYLSIRESIRLKDRRFFEEKGDWLLPSLESANDSGQDVFGDLDEFKEVKHLLNRLKETPTLQNFGEILKLVVESGFYTKAKELARVELEARSKQAQE